MSLFVSICLSHVKLQINSHSYNFFNNFLTPNSRIINAVMLMLGMGGCRTDMRKYWDIVNTHYIGEGWYNDGRFANQRDYYIAFAYHFYSLLWVYIDAEIDIDVRNKIIERAELFAKQFQCFFDADGAAVPYGRSLIYRFASVAFWSIYKLVGMDGVSDGIVKGIISRNLQYWMKQPIFRKDGILSVGYAYENHNIKERYGATGSPYWAMKVFVILMLEDQSSFWKGKSAALTDYTVRPIGNNTFIALRHQGGVSLFPMNMTAIKDFGNMIPKYEKFVYSSRHGFMCADTPTLGADSTISISYDGIRWIPKYKSKDKLIANDMIMYEWKPAAEGTIINSWLYVLGAWHVRIHVVRTPVPVKVADGGFCVPLEGAVEKRMGDCLVLVNHQSALSAAVATFAGKGQLKVTGVVEGSNILFKKAKALSVLFDVPQGKTILINAFYSGTQVPDAIPAIRLTWFNSSVIVKYKEGKRKIKLI